MTRTPPPPLMRSHVLRRLMASSSRRIYRNGVIVMSSLMMKTKLMIEKNGVPMKEKKLVTPQEYLHLVHLLEISYDWRIKRT
ncbi:hypothetical protein Q3G72_019221 [Acer saccharum]|nr:hypothetical protein Q3G72_019221 [Acer saccharum]